MKKAILWDNDGILVDTEQWYFKSIKEAFASVSIYLSQDDFFKFFLEGSNGTARFAAHHGLSELETESIKNQRNDLYKNYLATMPIVIEGVKDVLGALKPHFTMGIVTSSRSTYFETIHSRTGLLPFFDFVVTREDYEASKPSPDPYLAGVKLSGRSVQECIAIEDSPRGLVAASTAGVDCVVIPTELTNKADFSKASHRLESIKDLPSLLLDEPASTKNTPMEKS